MKTPTANLGNSLSGSLTTGKVLMGRTMMGYNTPSAATLDRIMNRKE